jgi:hypothetical protein
VSELPVGRALLGCLAGIAAVLVLALLVRSGAGLLAPPRTDDDVTVASVAEASGGPLIREVPLTDAPPLAGERTEDGVRTLAVVVVPLPGGGFSVLNAQSPIEACPVELAGDRLVDCTGAAWQLTGDPVDPALPRLQSFPARVDLGAVVADFSAPAGRIGIRPA